MRRLLILLCFSILLPFSASAAAKSAPLEVTGWIPYWRVATGTADVLPHLSAFTSIMPFGYVVQNDGTLHDAFRLGSPSTLTSSTSLALLAAAKAAKVKIIPTVMWSNGAAIHAILKNKAKRIALEDRIVELVKSQGFDGINIDFESKKAETRNYFSLFLQGLYSRMGNKFVYCAIEARTPVADRYDGTPPSDAMNYANDYAAINNYCDRVQLMTYDQETTDVTLNKQANGAPYIPVADPQWVSKVVALAAKTISKKKLEIGIATYGYEWSVTLLSQSGYRYDLKWAFNPRYALELAAGLALTPQRNSAGELSYTYRSAPLGSSTPTGDMADAMGSNTFMNATTTYSNGVAVAIAGSSYNIVWWSDAQAIADKVALAKKLGVRGVALFKIDGGEDQAMWDVLPKK